MGTSNDSDVANNNGAVVSSINNDDDKGKQDKDNKDKDYDETMSITTTSTATSTSYLAAMDDSHVNCNFEVNEVAIETNLIEVSRIKQLDFLSPLSLLVSSRFYY